MYSTRTLRTSDLYSRILPVLPQEDANYTSAHTLLRTSSHSDQFIAIHKPFILRSLPHRRIRPLIVLRNHTTNCTSLDFGVIALPRKVCRARANALTTPTQRLSFPLLIAHSQQTLPPTLCTKDASIAFLPLLPDDMKPINLLKRLLLAHVVLTRARSPWLSHAPSVKALVIIASHEPLYRAIRPRSATAISKLAQTLLAGPSIAVVRTLDELRAGCYGAGIVIGGLHNRLAIRDALNTTLSKPALALRDVVLHTPAAPPMRNRLVYVSMADGLGGEQRVIDALQDVARVEGIEFVVIGAPLQFSYIHHFANASVIVGVASDILALAPVSGARGAVLVEIALPGTRSTLFRSVTAYGIDYLKIPVSANVSDVDTQLLRHFVADKVHIGKARVQRTVTNVLT